MTLIGVCAVLTFGDVSCAALPRNSCAAAYGEPISALVREGIPFGDALGIKTDLSGHPVLVVRAACEPGREGGWSISAAESAQPVIYRSARMPYSDPVAILALYSYASGRLPAILAQVSFGMTGQPYELWTFDGRRIVRAKMTFSTTGPGSGLAGGGAAEHGQGVFCARRQGRLVITQLFWSGPVPGAPEVHDRGGGTTPAPGDKVIASYARWTLEGQPLREVGFRTLPTQVLTYVDANRQENLHC